MKNHNKTDNSMKGKRYAVALGIALVICAFFGGYLSGKRSADATAKVEESIPAQPEANEEAKVIDGFDVAAEFRERHNRALSPEAREDNRRKLWEENFPWEPTYDPEVTATRELLYGQPDSRAALDHHHKLKTFFESELRFSPQFEQIYRIMEKHDRTENPLALAGIFEVLTDYHKAARRDSEELVRESDGRPSMQRKRVGGPFESYTWGERLETDKEVLRGLINSGYDWPYKEPMSDELVDSIIEELVNEVPGMADFRGDFTSAGEKLMILGEWGQSLKEGDPLLVPYEGYQAGFDEWNDNRQRALNEGFAKQRAKDKPAGILADGTLVNADGEPIIASEGSFGGFASDGQRFDLQEMEDGSVRLSPEAMKALDEQFGNTPTPAPDNTVDPQLTDEEWRLQEVQRILEEAARQQE